MADESFGKRVSAFFFEGNVPITGMKKDMLIGVGLLVVFVLFGIVLVYAFFWGVIALLINLALIYITVLRLFLLWKQRKHLTIYGTSLIIAVLITLIIGGITPFWRITNILVLAIIIAEVWRWVKEPRRPKTF